LPILIIDASLDFSNNNWLSAARKIWQNISDKNFEQVSVEIRDPTPTSILVCALLGVTLPKKIDSGKEAG
jgi:hypothetical protein